MALDCKQSLFCSKIRGEERKKMDRAQYDSRLRRWPFEYRARSVFFLHSFRGFSSKRETAPSLYLPFLYFEYFRYFLAGDTWCWESLCRDPGCRRNIQHVRRKKDGSRSPRPGKHDEFLGASISHFFALARHDANPF